MISVARSPTTAEIQRAFRAGAKVVAGLPVRVAMDDGCVATLDVAAAVRGDPDPWMVEYVDGAVLALHSHSDLSVYVGGMAVTGDLPHVMAALRAVDGAGKHAASGDAARLAAGKAALRVRDAMVRARLLDQCDAWAAALGKLVDESDFGALYEPVDEEMRCRLLRVKCPSTGRIYVLCVPPDQKTAKAARLWTAPSWWGDSEPDAES